MKQKHTKKCEICGKEISVVIVGKNDTERLCVQCLVATYPALRGLVGML